MVATITKVCVNLHHVILGEVRANSLPLAYGGTYGNLLWIPFPLLVYWHQSAVFQLPSSSSRMISHFHSRLVPIFPWRCLEAISWKELVLIPIAFAHCTVVAWIATGRPSFIRYTLYRTSGILHLQKIYFAIWTIILPGSDNDSAYGAAAYQFMFSHSFSPILLLPGRWGRTVGGQLRFQGI